MDRRQFFAASVASVAFWGMGAGQTAMAQPIAFSSVPKGFRRVRPGDAGWPSEQSWQALKAEVGGRLEAVHSVIEPCLTDMKGEACAAVIKNARNPFYLGDQAGGTQVTGWYGAWRPKLSTYAIKAKTAADVAAGVRFARENRLRLVVKGTGHSYLGTSNAPDSLLIWTRAMKGITLHDAFVPKGMEGKAAPVLAVSAEAGCVWIDLYHAVTKVAGRYVQGGGCTDVGIAGLIQSGGYGSFSKGFGSASSHLLEAEIVTADGQIRIVNEANDPDLFFAIKGGGGGSWGVLTRLTLRTHDLPQEFGAAWGKVRAKSDAAFKTLIAKFWDHYVSHLFGPAWGEQVSFASDNTLKLSLVCQGISSAKAKADLESFYAWVRSQPDLEIVEKLGAGTGEARTWWDVEGNDSMIPDPRPGVPAYQGWWKGDQDQVSAYIHAYDSIWMPQSLLTKANRTKLTAAVFEASRAEKVDFHFNKGLAGASEAHQKAALNTATNPDSVSAFALVICATGGAPVSEPLGMMENTFSAELGRKRVKASMAALRQIAPNAGSYVSESDYFNTRWQEDYWGKNYARLLKAKAAYDPEGLFYVHHGVGSEAWAEGGFERV